VLISFLVRTLGGENYGVFVWAFSIIQYLIIVINFGFNTYAAKYVPENAGNSTNLNKIFSAILSFKLFLFVTSSVLFLVFAVNFPIFSDHYELLLILLGLGLGEAIFPIWLYQGKEKLEIPTKIIFIFKLLLVVLTITLITNSDHLLRYAYLLTFIQLMIGLTGLFFSFTKMHVRFIRVKFTELMAVIKEASTFFVGAVFGKSFNFLAVFLIGIYFSMEDVAGFDISFKVLAVFQLPFETLSTVLFPTMARTKNIRLNEKFIFAAFMASLFLWAFTYWQSDFLMSLLGGQELSGYGMLLRKLSVLIPIVVLTYFLGTNTLVAFGFHKEYNYSFIIPAIIYILTLAVLWKTEKMSFEAIVYSRIMVDLLMAGYRLFIAVKHRLIFSSR
jgi:PST family polysaccharide transporter